MKKVFTLSLFFISFLIKSQAPQSINYQAIARDGSGNIVTSAIGIKFQIYQGTLSGLPVYEETQTATPNSAGVFTVHIGKGSASVGTFNGIGWGSGPYFLQVSIDPAGGSSYSIVGASQLVSVPYALFAEKAGNVANYNAGNGIAITSGSIINTAPDQTVNISGAGVTGSYPNYSISSTSTSYTAGSGITIGAGIITNSAPDQTVTLSQGTNVSVNGTYPNFTIATNPSLTIAGNSLSISGGNGVLIPSSGTFVATPNTSLTGTGMVSITPIGTNTFNIAVPAQTLNLVSNVLSISGGNSVTLPTPPALSAGSGISIISGTINNTSPNQTVTLNSLGSVSVTGTYPNFTIAAPMPTVTPNPVIQGAGITSVNSSGSNYTVTTPPVGMNYVPGTGVLSYSPSPGTNTINISPAISFTNNALFVGSNSITIQGTGLWARTGTITSLFNANDFVGIGSNIPTTKLQVFGLNTSTNITAFSGSPESSIRLHNDDLTANNYEALVFTSKSSSLAHYESAKIVGVNTNHTSATLTSDLAFMTRDAGGISERMRITSNGYTGLGTSAPQQHLHLYYSGTNVGVALDAGTAGRARLGFLPGGVDNGEIGYKNSLTFGTIANSSLVMTNEWMRITNAGNVGIGTSSPSQKLDISGKIRINDATQGSGKVLTSDATGTGTWNYPLNPIKTGAGSGISIANNNDHTYDNATIITITPTVSGTVLLQFNADYNFQSNIASQIEVGLYINTTGVAPITTTNFTWKTNAGFAFPPTGGGYCDIPVSVFYTMNVTAGTTYYVWYGANDLNFAQTSCFLGLPRIVATLHQNAGM